MSEELVLNVTLVWLPGEPPKPWRDEWFIAETTYGERVVLRSLPDEWTYDYTTADETYIKAGKIAYWMQFPDSAYGSAAEVAIERLTKEKAADAERIKALEAQKDGAYAERNMLVALLARVFPSGVKRTDIPGWDAEWQGCVYIDLPTGQASWHYHDREARLFEGLPPYAGEWDGHSTEEKYKRVARALARSKTDE